MTDPLLQQGLDLMIYGMSTVFLFLTLLVLVTMTASAIIGRLFPEMPETDLLSPHSVSTPNTSSNTSSEGSEDKKLLAILQNAIDQHRSRK
ncbi:MAG: OadG family transporter subunit [Porticoccus sp.]